MYPNSSYPRDLITLLFWQENLKISKELSVFWARRYLIESLQKLMSPVSRLRRIPKAMLFDNLEKIFCALEVIQ